MRWLNLLWSMSPISVSKKTGHLVLAVLAHDFGKCWPLFNNSSTVGLSSDYLTKLSPSITSHLTRVATPPCETSAFKNDIINTLINSSSSFPSWSNKQDYSIFRHLIWFDYICCDIALSFWTNSAGCCLFRKIFFRLLTVTWNLHFTR